MITTKRLLLLVGLGAVSAAVPLGISHADDVPIGPDCKLGCILVPSTIESDVISQSTVEPWIVAHPIPITTPQDILTLRRGAPPADTGTKPMEP